MENDHYETTEAAHAACPHPTECVIYHTATGFGWAPLGEEPEGSVPVCWHHVHVATMTLPEDN